MIAKTPQRASIQAPSRSTTYQAFMSYSHATDGKLAPALQSALQRFAKPWYRLRALHIFRDTTTLAVTPGLWSAIQTALDQSAYFILLASPEAAESVWVRREIDHWLERNSPQRMLIVLTGGAMVWDRAAGAFDPSSTTALPAMLMRTFPEEPLYLDLRWTHSQADLSLRHPGFRDAVAELAAGLRGCAKDEIIGEDIRQHRRTLHIAWSAGAILAIFTIVSVIAALVAIQQRSIAEVQRAAAVEQSHIALARQLAAQATSVRVQFPDRLPLAVLLALESGQLHPSFEGNQALRAALTLLPRPIQSYAYDDPSGQGRVRALSFSVDGNYLGVARDDGTAAIFEPGKRGVSRTLVPDQQKVAVVELSGEQPGESSDVSTEMTSLAFSPDGHILATASNDGTARLWETTTGRALLTVRHGSHVVSVAFSSDGSLLATGSADGKLRVFAVASGSLLSHDTTPPEPARKMFELRMEFKHGDEVRQVMFSPDGRLLAAISTDGGISVSNLEKKEPRRVWGAGVSGLGLAFSRDGKRLATANGNLAFVWDVTTGRELFKAMHANSADDAEDHLRWVDSVALSPDGTYLATGGRDSTARVWNLTTGQELVRLPHSGPVEAVAFSRDGAMLGTGSFDGTARLWELPSGRERLRATHPGGSEVVAFSSDGKQIASGGTFGAVSVWSFSRSDKLAAITHLDEVSAVSMSPGGDRVATADSRNGLRIWRPDGSIEFASDARARGSLVFSEDGRFLAGTPGDSLFVMDLTKDHALTTLATFRDASDYSLGPRYLVGIGRDRQHIRVWETAGGRELPQVATSGPQAVELDSTGSFLAIKQLDEYGRHGAIRVTDLAGHTDLRQFPIDGNVPREFALGPGGRVLAQSFSQPSETNSKRNDYVEVRDTSAGRLLARLPQEGLVGAMQFDPSGTRLIALAEGGANSRQQLDVWDWAAGKLRARLLHEDEISKIRFSEDSAVLATVSAGHVYVWDYLTGELLSQLADAGYVRDLRLSRDGRYLLTGGSDGTAAIWLWKSEDLRTEACKRLTRDLSPIEWQQYLGAMPYHPSCPSEGRHR